MLSEVNFSKSHALVIHLSSGIPISVSTHTSVWSIVRKVYSLIPLQWLANYNKDRVPTAHYDLRNTIHLLFPGFPSQILPLSPLFALLRQHLFAMVRPHSLPDLTKLTSIEPWSHVPLDMVFPPPGILTPLIATGLFSQKAFFVILMLFCPLSTILYPTNNTCPNPRWFLFSIFPQRNGSSMWIGTLFCLMPYPQH